jgi:hypothetical protein
VAIWPAVEAASARGARESTVTMLAWSFRPTPEVALLLLVTFSSSLGSALHACISFTDYVGNRRLATSWVWWYLLRVLVGTSLALVFYFAVRGGLFSTTTSTDVINPFGVAALAGLVGLFNKQATDKLREVFDTMFRTAPGHGDAQRDDSIVNPLPVVAGLEPAQVAAGGDAVELTLRGDGFVPGAGVRLTRAGDPEGALLQRSATVVSPGELRVTLDADDLAEAGTVSVTVLNPPPGGGPSLPVTLEVR